GWCSEIFRKAPVSALATVALESESAPLVLVQLELLDGRRLSALPISRFDRTDMFAFAAHDDDVPASELGELFERDASRHAGKIMAADAEGGHARALAEGRGTLTGRPLSATWLVECYPRRYPDIVAIT